MTTHLVHVRDNATGEIVTTHGPMTERRADRREETLLGRIDLERFHVYTEEVES